MTVFKKYKVQPEGRNKYGGYYSKENVRSNLTYSIYNGNLSTETIPNGDKPNTGTTNNNAYILFLLSTQGNFEGSSIAISAQTSTSRLISYCNSNPVVSFIGNIGDSADTHNGITGFAESGMTISIINNGTTATTLQVTVNSSLNRSQGTLTVPCYVPKDGEVGMEDSWAAWKELADSNSLFYQELEWSWYVSSDATSPFILDLTNETGSVNCDVNGNVLPGAVLPDCWARLYYGEELLRSATYSIYIAPGYNANGVNFNTNTGYLYFSNNLSFDGKVLVIEITGTYAGTSRTANFTLNKNIPGEAGQPGQDAVAKWIETSTEEVVFDPNTSAFTPNSVSCRVLKQVGSGTPEEITSSETVWYKYSNDLSWTSGTSVSVNMSLPLKEYVIFALATPNFTIYEQETVHILSNGKNGEPGSGATGPAGPSVRGPVDWYSGITENRRFCNGRGPLSEDARFIDIILKDGTYYQCNISYNATPSDSWESVSSAWTEADASYNFVATELLLAENAKIKFLSNNALYLMSGDTVTAGAEGGSGSTIAFWAGSSSPSGAPFRVDHAGNMSATTGQFGFMKIGSINYMGNGVEGSYTYPEYSEWNGCTSQVALSPQAIMFDLYSGNSMEQQVIVGAITQLHSLVNYPISVYSDKGGYSGYTIGAIGTDGQIQAPLFTSYRRDIIESYGLGEMHPLMTPDLARIPIVFITPSGITSANTQNYFSQCNYGENKGYWVFRGTGGSRTSWTSGGTTFHYYINTSSGISTGVRWDEYPYVNILDSNHVVGFTPSYNRAIGHWFFARTKDDAVYPRLAYVKLMSTQTAEAEKLNHVIYMEVE